MNWPSGTKKLLAVTQYECFRNQAKVSTAIAGFMVVRQDKADAAVEACGAAIAELEAKLAALEAENKRLKARRCDECNSREGQSHYCLLWSVNTPDHHSCSDWEARP